MTMMTMMVILFQIQSTVNLAITRLSLTQIVYASNDEYLSGLHNAKFSNSGLSTAKFQRMVWRRKILIRDQTFPALALH